MRSSLALATNGQVQEIKSTSWSHISWPFFVVLVVVATVTSGVTIGRSELATDVTIASSNLTIHHAKITQRGRPTVLTFNLRPNQTTTQLHFRRTMLKDYHVVQVSPAPAKVTSTASTITYSFVHEPNNDLEVKVEVVADVLGATQIEAGTVEDMHTIRQFSFPFLIDV